MRTHLQARNQEGLLQKIEEQIQVLKTFKKVKFYKIPQLKNKELNYGNKTIGKDVTDFWLDESLRITAFEEIRFLKQLQANNLAFKQEDINLLKELMIDEKSENYVVRAKTGWEGKYGWYVGYVETKNDVWFFALNIDTKTKEDLAKRKAITLEALKTKGIID